jgi:hypothetical protein
VPKRRGCHGFRPAKRAIFFFPSPFDLPFFCLLVLGFLFIVVRPLHLPFELPLDIQLCTFKQIKVQVKRLLFDLKLNLLTVRGGCIERVCREECRFHCIRNTGSGTADFVAESRSHVGNGCGGQLIYVALQETYHEGGRQNEQQPDRKQHVIDSFGSNKQLHELHEQRDGQRGADERVHELIQSQQAGPLFSNAGSEQNVDEQETDAKSAETFVFDVDRNQCKDAVHDTFVVAQSDQHQFGLHFRWHGQWIRFRLVLHDAGGL